EFALETLANDVEQVLAEEPEAVPRIFFAKDFDNPGLAPEDLATSPDYLKRTADGRREHQPVSFGAPSFLIAPGAGEREASDDIARLARLEPRLKEIYKRLLGAAHWVYISLESGAYISYPGHGPYPENFSPKDRPWYKNAADSFAWTLPIVDATSGLVTFTLSKRIHRPDGSFAGVVALDILLSDVIAEEELSSIWTSEVRTFSVVKTENAKTGETGLLIIGRKAYQERTAGKEGLIQFEWLASSDSERFSAFLDQLAEGASGYIDLSFNGVESIWAYANIETNRFFVIIVPKSVIRKLPDKQVRAVSRYTRDQLVVTFVTALLVIICLAAAAFLSARTISKTIIKISSAIEKLAHGDFSVHLNIRTNDERDKVIEAFNEMGPKLEDNMRFRKSLDLAMEVQQSLLPRSDPRIEGLDIAGTSIYCDRTGGDYYDYLSLGEGKEIKVGVVVGDVSDHGIPSALLMAAARSSLRQRSALPGGLDVIVSDVNNRLAEDVQSSGRFMTLFFLSIDPRNRSLQWVRAGHDPAIFYDPGTDAFEKLIGSGVALGVDENRTYEVNEKDGLREGQIIVIATDGIWEARNPEGVMFGKEPIYNAMRQSPHLDAKSILDLIIDSLKRFQEDAAVEDDATLVVIKIDPN
ncbi:MAG: SpoIIE family protein phosphatase, partial [Desulfobacterales bacterium]|nr:SpoIIE family protein phosphatase [Desulfobacterales bacterium]